MQSELKQNKNIKVDTTFSCGWNTLRADAEQFRLRANRKFY